MNKFWQVYIYELQRNIRRKGFIFATIGVPIVGLLFMLGYELYQNLPEDTQAETNPLALLSSLERLEKAGYVDYSGVFEPLPADLESILQAYPDEDSALAAMNSGDIDVYLVIAEDYLETGDVILHLPNLSLMLVTDGASLAEFFAYSVLADDLDQTSLQRLSNPVNFQTYDLSQEGGEDSTSEFLEGGRFVVVYIFTMLFFVSLLLTNTYLMQTVIEERENRLIEIIISTVRPSQLLAGKILAMGTLGIIQISVWLASSALLTVLAGNLSALSLVMTSLNIDLRADLLPLVAVYFVMMYLLYAAVFGTIGAMSGSSQEGSQYAAVIIIPTIIPFYFFQLIQVEPHGIAAMILSLFPITSPVTILMRMVITDVPLWQIALSLAIQFVTMIAALWMAGRIFRVQTLLSGQKVKLNEVARLLFAENAPRKAKEN